jgi:phosphoribosylcarboxyaminoimidazole (NCAIR) mutase
VVPASAKLSLWLKIARAGGLAPLILAGNSALEDADAIASASTSGDLVVFVPCQLDTWSEQLVSALKMNRSVPVIFMAVSGAREVLAEGSVIPSVNPVSVFCAMPYFREKTDNSVFAELLFLEHALRDVPLDELPSIFPNHQRNRF